MSGRKVVFSLERVPVQNEESLDPEYLNFCSQLKRLIFKSSQTASNQLSTQLQLTKDIVLFFVDQDSYDLNNALKNIYKKLKLKPLTVEDWIESFITLANKLNDKNSLFK